VPARRSVREAFGIDEALGDLADRLTNAATRPNANRITLLPGQHEFFRSQKKNRIEFGGNQAGKTFSGVYDECMVLLRRHPHRQHLYPEGPLRMRFIGVDFDRGIDQGAIPNFQQILPPSALVDGSWERSYRNASHMLTLADGSTVSMMSYEQDPNKFQIVQLHHIHFDEEPPKPIFQESLPRLVRYGGTWTITETPVQQLEWIQDELMEPAQAGQRPDIGVFYLNTQDNTYLSDDAVADLIAGISAEDRVVRLQGQYKAGSLVFPEFERKYPYVISDRFMPRGPEWDIYASMDYGWSHPTAWLWTAVHRGGSIVTFRCLYASHVMVKDWASAVLEMNAQIAKQLGEDPTGWRPKAYFGDPAIGQANGISGTTVQQEYALHGIPIGTEGIVKARVANQNFGLDKMHEYLSRDTSHISAATGYGGEPWWQITENCTALIDELKKARKPKQTLKMAEQRAQPEGIRDKDNDAIDAVKYLFMITHDLRPASPEPLRYSAELPEQFRNAAAPPPVYASDVSPRVVTGYNPWEVTSGGVDYQELEG
jgi:phage terminase large subunit-like protein